jgi:hypothetical protein
MVELFFIKFGKLPDVMSTAVTLAFQRPRKKDSTFQISPGYRVDPVSRKIGWRGKLLVIVLLMFFLLYFFILC